VVVPSQSGLGLGEYSLKITASDGQKSSATIVHFQIVDNCFEAPDSVVSCGNGTCVDGFKQHTCDCFPGFIGSECDTEVVLKNDASQGALSSGATAGIVIAIIVVLVLVLIVVLVVMRRKKAEANKLSEIDGAGQAAVFNNGFMKDDTYDMPIYGSAHSDFEPGVANPMYAWYQPGMSRQECEDFLSAQGEGAFVIRDSSFTPGWHMLAVKTNNSIVHERIKLHADGTYEMLPSSNAHQPNFQAIPELVDHYASCKREGVPFSLALDNPIYDNHLLQAAPRTAQPLDTIYEADAPVVPMREHEREQVAALAGDDQELYTNTAEAKALTTHC
jgi:hypothetical protein